MVWDSSFCAGTSLGTRGADLKSTSLVGAGKKLCGLPQLFNMPPGVCFLVSLSFEVSEACAHGRTSLTWLLVLVRRRRKSSVGLREPGHQIFRESGRRTTEWGLRLLQGVSGFQ